MTSEGGGGHNIMEKLSCPEKEICVTPTPHYVMEKLMQLNARHNARGILVVRRSDNCSRFSPVIQTDYNFKLSYLCTNEKKTNNINNT